MSVSFGKFQNAVVWGVKGKILCPVGCQNPVAQITKAKEILKNPRPAGRKAPLRSNIGERKKGRPQRAASPVLSVLCTEEPDRGSLRQLQSKFLPRCQNPQFCGFAPRGKLVGECLPQTLLCGLRRKNISVRQAAFLREPPRKYLTDQPIFCDK